MRVFLTGATGFIGSAIVHELIEAGHEVLGLARSDGGAETLGRLGAEVQRGSLEDADALRTAAASVDAVIHTAFDHDFSQFAMHCENDRRVIEGLGSVLAGTDKPLIITSVTGVAQIEPGTVAKEEDPPVSVAVHPRAASEEAAYAAAKLGCRTLVMRMPQVHDMRKHGLWDYTMQIAREKGVSAYTGNGLNRWPAAHVLDTARLYRLCPGEGACRSRIQRSSGGRGRHARHRQRDRTTIESSGCFTFFRGGTATLRLAGKSRGAGPSSIKREDEAGTELEPNAPRNDSRSNECRVDRR